MEGKEASHEVGWGEEFTAQRDAQSLTACRTSLVSDGAFSTESTVTVVAISTLSCCWNRPFSIFRGRCCLG